MDSQNLDALVVSYLANKNPETLNTILLECKEYVHTVVAKVHNVVPSVLDISDLEQCGMLGLLSAIDRYDPSFGVPFRSWAYRRIRGAAIDQVRTSSSTSRSRSVTWVDINELLDDAELHERYSYDIDDIMPSDISENLRSAILALPPMQSYIILLEMNGLALSKVSKIVGLSRRMASFERTQALKALRENLLNV